MFQESRELTLATPSHCTDEDTAAALTLHPQSCHYKQADLLLISPAVPPLSVSDIVCKSRSYNSVLRSLPEDALLSTPDTMHGSSRARTSPRSADQHVLPVLDAPRLSPSAPRHAAVRRRSAEALPSPQGGGHACPACDGAGATSGGRSQDHVRWCLPVTGEDAAAAAARTTFPPRLGTKSCQPLGSTAAPSPAPATVTSTSPHAPGPHSTALSPGGSFKPRMPISPTGHRSHAPLSAFERLLKAVSNSEVHSYGGSFGHSNFSSMPHSNSIPNAVYAGDAARGAPAAAAGPLLKPRSSGSLAAASCHTCRAHVHAPAPATQGDGACCPAPVQWCDSAHQHIVIGSPPVPGQCCQGHQRRSSSVAEYSVLAKLSRDFKVKSYDAHSSPAPKAAAAAAAASGLHVDIPEDRSSRSSPPCAPVSPPAVTYYPLLGTSSRKQGSGFESGSRSTNRSGNLPFLDSLPDLVDARAAAAAAQRCALALEPALPHQGCGGGGCPEPSMGMVKLMKHVRELRLEVEAYRQQNTALKAALKLEGDARSELTAARQQLESAHQQLRELEDDAGGARVGCFSFWTWGRSKPRKHQLNESR